MEADLTFSMSQCGNVVTCFLNSIQQPFFFTSMVVFGSYQIAYLHVLVEELPFLLLPRGSHQPARHHVEQARQVREELVGVERQQRVDGDQQLLELHVFFRQPLVLI